MKGVNALGVVRNLKRGVMTTLQGSLWREKGHERIQNGSHERGLRNSGGGYIADHFHGV